jgi:formylglycine-generating enzyme required for sulfatase activity
MSRLLAALVLMALAPSSSFANWLPVTGVNAWSEPTELAGPRLIVEYTLDAALTPEQPAYVFVRYRLGPEDTWRLLPAAVVGGNGAGIVTEGGARKIIWWGAGEHTCANVDQVEFRVRAIAMARVPGGAFTMRSLPGQGRDKSGMHSVPPALPTYYLARYETTTAMYADYLNEIGADGAGYHENMANEKRCGILREADGSYSVAAGRETHPVTYVSWYDATGFLRWCGLRLPTEPEWEKASCGGLFLDGDETKAVPNPNPGRQFPWGDEVPNADGQFRCNYDGEEDGFPGTAPVGSFAAFHSPYGIADLAGNVNEWTENWYTTSYHAGLDGYRVVRGGSWLDVPAGCDGVTGATTLPIKESSIMGFRGALSAP